MPFPRKVNWALQRMQHRKTLYGKSLYNSLSLCLDQDLSFYLAGLPEGSSEEWPDITEKQMAALALRRSFTKKFVEEKADDADHRALEKFRAANDSCRDWKWNPETSWDEVLFGELRRSLDLFWHKDGYSLVHSDYSVLDRGKLGPGASVLANGCDFYTKLMASPLAVTHPDLYRIYKDYVSHFPRWDHAEIIRSEQHGQFCVVPGNKLSFAPKTVDISRLICTEPGLNSFYQLGLGLILEDRLKEVFNISLVDQQEINGELARCGSVTNRFATIDLSSASDLIGLPMLKAICPSEMVGWLCRYRSPVMELTDGSQVELHMVSTMGNGFTFPLETAIFSCVVSACMRAQGIKMVRNRKSPCRLNREHLRPGNFGVFGDDIIVPTEIVGDVLRLLHLIGHKPNADKTFVEGPFANPVATIGFVAHPCGVSILRTSKRLRTCILPSMASIDGPNKLAYHCQSL